MSPERGCRQPLGVERKTRCTPRRTQNASAQLGQRVSLKIERTGSPQANATPWARHRSTSKMQVPLPIFLVVVSVLLASIGYQRSVVRKTNDELRAAQHAFVVLEGAYSEFKNVLLGIVTPSSTFLNSL